ncbi:MAG: hypothetical protein M1828_005618 [Chrysothrix sp. TS-e1954]|nr:MAG: hypothetical protein M1828_005618 [Chrysothrix sp. TS-e1954]
MAAAAPDISAILAALSQRPNGTPSQGGSSQAHGAGGAAFPGAQSPPTPSHQNNGMSLPQPSNAGNLDLSAIKPVSSGSVSLADAIAIAQGKAAAKSSAPDPRLAGRSFAQTRSRSRSPARQDAFRDNYNPYRDERRDGSRRGVAEQGRSFSPAQPFTGQSEPHQNTRVRSPPGRPMENSEIITVESSSVGLIIGRAGENMRRIEQESGARVQFINGPESSGPMRQCRITGQPRQRKEAIAEIFRVAADGPQGQSRTVSIVRSTPTIVSPPPTSSGSRNDGRTEQIMVPDRTVGLIIGRGGETIRDLQERSGCHVNIVGENKSVNGLRPVNLIGAQEFRDQAKALILEVVESDTRGTAQSSQAQPPRQNFIGGYDPYAAAMPAPTPMPAPAPYDPYSGGAKMNDALMVPSEAVGMIIGKGGETIKEMQNASSAKINVSQPAGADIERHIELIGTRHACENAKRLIWEKVNTVREKQGGLSRGPEPPMHSPYGQPPPQQYPPPAYGQPPPMMPPPQSMPQLGPPETPADPYAAYGGYQAYMAMWYAAMAGQGQNGAAPPH